jgi:hypothetical protein
MIAIGLVSGLIALRFVCWLLFNLAVYAPPCLTGISAAFWSLHHGSGYLGALTVALLSGMALDAALLPALCPKAMTSNLFLPCSRVVGSHTGRLPGITMGTEPAMGPYVTMGFGYLWVWPLCPPPF